MTDSKHRRIVGIASLFFSLAFFAGVGTADASELTGDNVIPLINQSRGETGVKALTKNAKLTQAATAKANDMFKQQYFAHVGPDGNGPSYWAKQAGYDWSSLGENIAYGYKTAESVHTAFMNSDGHRKNILNARYEHVGVAAVGGTYQGRSTMMVVEEFGASNDPAEDAPAQTGSDTTPQTKYVLTVSGGSGSGSYAQGEKVTVTAAAPETGKAFDAWIGDVENVADVHAASTTVTMPEKAISLTATYKATEETPGEEKTSYKLTVSGGSGSGTYETGKKVTVIADAAPEGKVFDKWTGDTDCVSDANAATATVTMPAKDLTLTATYKSTDADTDTQAKKYYVRVGNGSGDGWYAAGASVTITADAASARKVFHKWTGRTEGVADVTAASTTFTMPEHDVTIFARYKSAASTRHTAGKTVRNIWNLFGCR